MQGDPSASIVERFREMSPDEFQAEVESLWNAGGKVIGTISELVQEGSISPLQGLGIIGCTASQLYAYNAFHGEASVSDLASALLPSGNAGNRTTVRT